MSHMLPKPLIALVRTGRQGSRKESVITGFISEVLVSNTELKIGQIVLRTNVNFVGFVFTPKLKKHFLDYVIYFTAYKMNLL